MSRPYVMVAPTGARRSKVDHPRLPITLQEITETAVACFDAGANAMHLHIRDKKGLHTLDLGQYSETLSEIARHVPSMSLQITTESAGIFDVSSQLECLNQVKPKWASISIQEIARDRELAPRVYRTCAENGTRVQHIIYDQTDLVLLQNWQNQGIVKQLQSEVLFVLGRYNTMQLSKPSHIDTFLPHIGKFSNWMVCAFGPREHDCLVRVAHQGGAVRIGFENNISDENGSKFKDNTASLVAFLGKLEGKSE